MQGSLCHCVSKWGTRKRKKCRVRPLVLLGTVQSPHPRKPKGTEPQQTHPHGTQGKVPLSFPLNARGGGGWRGGFLTPPQIDVNPEKQAFVQESPFRSFGFHVHLQLVSAAPARASCSGFEPRGERCLEGEGGEEWGFRWCEPWTHSQ